MSAITQLDLKDAVAVSAPAAASLKVGVLVDLALTPEAGGHVKCWQRLAEAAVEFGDRLDQPLADLIRDGLKIPVERYNETKRFVADSRRRFAEIFKSTPVILTPAAPGPAPLGLSTTGDPRMNAPWTAMGNPALSIPMPLASGLPLGLQLTADIGQDSRVLQAALLLDQRFSAGPKILP